MIRPDQIIRSRRRTIALEITPDARVIIRAPQAVSMAYLERLVERKQAWLARKLAFAEQWREQAKKRSYCPGEEFLYLGRGLRLQAHADQAAPIRLGTDTLDIREKNLPRAEQLIVAWYRQQSLAVISERTRLLAQKHGFRYQRIRITGARKRWGSCSHCNNLSFSWRLIMAPLAVVDYVVVHELCHTAVKNHSAKYWDLVKAVMPDYRGALQWLRQNRGLMEH